MDCPAAGWWEVGLNLLGGVLVAYGFGKARKVRRLEREATALRATLAHDEADMRTILDHLARIYAHAVATESPPPLH